MLVLEGAAVEGENFAYVVEDSWQSLDVSLVSFRLRLWCIHKDIWLGGMGMDIQKHLKPTDLSFRELLLEFVPEQLHLISPVVSAFSIIIRVEVAVHVLALQVRSVIAGNDSIWVDCREDPDLVQLSELVREDVSGHEVVHKPMNDEAAMRFAWVLSANHNDDRFLFEGVCIIVYVRYFYNWYVYLSQTLAQRVEPHKLVVL